MAIVTFNTPTDMSALSTSLSSISATSFKYEPVGSATDWLSCHGGEFDSMIGYTGHFEKTEDGVYGTIKAAYISQGQDGLPGIEVHGISYAMNDFFYTNYFWGGAIATQVELILSGNDTMTGTLEDDVMLGFEGNDLLIGGGGADTLKGGPGSNTASYQTAKAGLFAGLEDTGANSGDAAGDTYVDIQNLTGSNFADTLYGDGYANMFKGGAGNDLMVGKGAGDRFLGGAGSGTVGYDADYFGVIADLMKPGRNTGTAAGDTYSSIENLAGSTYNDKLYGDDRANTLASNVYPDTPSGDDQLYGRGGNDHLKGYDGVDRLEGGAGRDILSGGTSSDVFAFAEKLTAANWDTITDFSHAEDRIDIDNAVFAGMDLGMLSAGRFKAIASATSRSGVNAGDRILYDKAHGDLYFDRDGSGHRFDREKFASVADGTALDHTDIFVF